MLSAREPFAHAYMVCIVCTCASRKFINFQIKISLCMQRALDDTMDSGRPFAGRFYLSMDGATGAQV